MELDPRVAAYYDTYDESARLWETDRGRLVRLRTPGTSSTGSCRPERGSPTSVAGPARTPLIWRGRAYFHRVDEPEAELSEAGFRLDRLVAVEGFAWLLGNLAELLQALEPLLRALRLTESVPSMLGVTGHLLAIADKVT